MFTVSQTKERDFWHVQKQANLEALFNRRLFRANDTPLTYRQINLLSENRLLHVNRDNKRGWRKLSIKDVIFTHLVFELRSFGLKDKQLFGLADSFYKPAYSPDHISTEVNHYSAILGLGLSLFKNKIYLFIHPDGSVNFCDQKSVQRILNNSKGAIYINFSKIVRVVWGKLINENESFNLSVTDFIEKLNQEGELVNDRQKEIIKDMQDLLVEILLDSFIESRKTKTQSTNKKE